MAPIPRDLALEAVCAALVRPRVDDQWALLLASVKQIPPTLLAVLPDWPWASLPPPEAP